MKSRELGLESGQVFAVPVPSNFAMDEGILNNIIEEALESARVKGIAGKEITPFLLAEVAKATKGQSLQTSILIRIYDVFIVWMFTNWVSSGDSSI